VAFAVIVKASVALCFKACKYEGTIGVLGGVGWGVGLGVGSTTTSLGGGGKMFSDTMEEHEQW